MSDANARVLVVGDDPYVRRAVVQALLDHAHRELRAGRPDPWARSKIEVGNSDHVRPDPTPLGEDADAGNTGRMLLDLDAVAVALSVNRRTVERLTASGRLPTVHLGRRTLVRRADLERLVEQLGAA